VNAEFLNCDETDGVVEPKDPKPVDDPVLPKAAKPVDDPVEPKDPKPVDDPVLPKAAKPELPKEEFALPKEAPVLPKGVPELPKEATGVTPAKADAKGLEVCEELDAAPPNAMDGGLKDGVDCAIIGG